MDISHTSIIVSTSEKYNNSVTIKFDNNFRKKINISVTIKLF